MNEELKALLEEASNGKAETIRETMEVIFPRMVDLSEAEVEQVFAALKKATGTGIKALRADWRDYLRSKGLLEGREDSVGTLIVGLALSAGIDLWHDPENAAWLTTTAGEHHPIRSRAARLHLARLYHDKHGKAAHAQGLQDAIQTLEAHACFKGEQHQSFVRVAEANGRVYLDLANAAWELIEIAADGWRVIPALGAPVRFRRARGMLPLPTPQNGGSIKELAKLLGVGAENALLLTGWLVGALNPSGPYPILILEGEQGVGKSVLAGLLRGLIDPNIAGLRSTPKEEGDLIIAAVNSHMLNFDNLSGLPAWLSDALCRLATGVGFAKRQLYSDGEEAIFCACRPIILNGIDSIATRHDLADRSIVLGLQPIPTEGRRSEKEICAEVARAHPQLLGALLDAIACALRRKAEVRLTPPRMADFAIFVAAAEPALGCAEGDFIKAYEGNRKELVEQSLANDPVAQAVLAELDKHNGHWEGTATELYSALTVMGGSIHYRIKNAQGMANALRRMAPALRAAGVSVEFRHSGKRLIVLERVGKPASTASVASNANDDPDSGVDASSASSPTSGAVNESTNDEDASLSSSSTQEANVSDGLDAVDDVDAKIPTHSEDGKSQPRDEFQYDW